MKVTLHKPINPDRLELTVKLNQTQFSLLKKTYKYTFIQIILVCCSMWNVEYLYLV